MKKGAGRLKLELSQYRDLEAFAQFGSDLDPETQRTLARGERLVKTLNQGEGQPIPVEEQGAAIYAATNGYLDRISADRVEEFHEGLRERVRSAASEALEKMREGDWSDETQKALDRVIKEYAEDFGYDLDEEGQPLSEDAEDAATARRRSRDEDRGNGSGSAGNGATDGDSSEREGEPAGASAAG